MSNTQRARLAFLTAMYPDAAGQVEGFLATDMNGLVMANGVSVCVTDGRITFGDQLTEGMKGWMNGQANNSR